jgi:hypothetical protein
MDPNTFISDPDRPAPASNPMEPLRPIVDRNVPKFVQAHTFHPLG